jgi:hypothetical protein
VLGDVDGSSSLRTSMSLVVERLEGRINTPAANEVYWRSRSALVSTMSHFSELDIDLEVLESRHSAGLTKDEVGPGCTWLQTRWHHTFLL